MRKLAWSILLAACSPTVTAIPWDGGPDVDGATGDAPVAPDDRLATAVVVGAHDVSWSRGDQACGIARGVAEGPCPGSAPGVVTAPIATGVGIPRIINTAGVPSLVGDDSALFFFDGDITAPKRYLARLEPGAPEMILATFQTTLVYGPIIDATNVYWFADTNLYRASRTGDGSDAAIIASTPNPSLQMATSGGYVWWSFCADDCVLRRVPAAGGAVEDVELGYYLLGASSTTVYLAPQDGSQIVARTAAGVQTVAVAQTTAPIAFVVDGGELFWSTVTALMRAVPGGTPQTVVDVTGESAMFGVTSDSILYGFTATGYQSTPR